MLVLGHLSFLDLWYDSHEVHLYGVIAYID
jgi:hypothetical protein